MRPFYEHGFNNIFVGDICKSPYPVHVHEVVQIIHVTAGLLTMSVNGIAYDLKPGDTLTIFPVVPHSYDMVSNDAEGVCVIFVPQTIKEHAATFVHMRPADPLLPAEKADKDLLDTIQKLHQAAADPESPLRVAYIHLYVSQLLMKLTLQDMEEAINHDLIQKALHYVSQHYLEDLNLDNVSKVLGISRPYLSHIFSEQLNINFRRYINNLRIENACSLLLETDKSITEIGYLCGYNNLRTFRRAFHEENGMQPGEFRAALTKQEHTIPEA